MPQSHKQFLQILVQKGRMWSWPYLREVINEYSEQECEKWHKTIIEKWLVYYKERWEELLNIASRDEIETIWRECIKPQGNYFQYANEYFTSVFELQNEKINNVILHTTPKAHVLRTLD